MTRMRQAPCSLCSVACFSPHSTGQWEQGLVPTSPPPGQLSPCSCPRPAVSAPAAFAGSLGPVGPEGWPLVIPGFLTSGSLRVIVHNFPVGPALVEWLSQTLTATHTLTPPQRGFRLVI